MGYRRWSFPEPKREPEPSRWLGFILGHVGTLVVVGAFALEVARQGVDLPSARPLARMVSGLVRF